MQKSRLVNIFAQLGVLVVLLLHGGGSPRGTCSEKVSCRMDTGCEIVVHHVEFGGLSARERRRDPLQTHQTGCVLQRAAGLACPLID